MIRLRRSDERGRADHGWLETRHSFSFAGYREPDWDSFSVLRVLNEDVVQPNSGFPTHAHADMEILTYIVSGRLVHQDSMGESATLGPDEVQLLSARSGVTHSEWNGSQDVPLHLLQVWIEPREPGGEPGYEAREFPRAGRRRRLRLLAAPGGAEGSLSLGADVRVYASLLDAQAMVGHEVLPGRCAWLQIVRGQVTLAGHALDAGDAAGVEEPCRLELGAEADTELLLFDLPLA